MSRGRNPGKTNASATAAPETKAGRETFSTDAACVRFSQVKDGNSTQHTFAFTCFSFSLCRAFHGKVLFVLLSETLPLAGWAGLLTARNVSLPSSSFSSRLGARFRRHRVQMTAVDARRSSLPLGLCVCVCARARAPPRPSLALSVCVSVCRYVCTCVCVRVRRAHMRERLRL